MISITRYISEGFLGNLDKKFQKTAFAGKVDKINNKIDNVLSRSSLGRSYMRMENKLSDGLKKDTLNLKNDFLNLKDDLQGKNYKIRK
jgi:hypothetical protein